MPAWSRRSPALGTARGAGWHGTIIGASGDSAPTDSALGRKTSECEGRGGETATQTVAAIFSDIPAGKSWLWREARLPPTLVNPTQWLKSSDWEWEERVRKWEREKRERNHFAHLGFSSSILKVSKWKWCQCLLSVSEWHLCRLSILLLLLLLQLSKCPSCVYRFYKSLLCPPVTTTKLRNSDELNLRFWLNLLCQNSLLQAS